MRRAWLLGAIFRLVFMKLFDMKLSLGRVKKRLNVGRYVFQAQDNTYISDISSIIYIDKIIIYITRLGHSGAGHT